jgi:hypothetical protein
MITKIINFKEKKLVIAFYFLVVLFYIFHWIEVYAEINQLKYLFKYERGSDSFEIEFLNQLFLILIPIAIFLVYKGNRIGIYTIIFSVFLCFFDFLRHLIFFLIEDNSYFSFHADFTNVSYQVISFLLILTLVFTKLLSNLGIKKNQLLLPLILSAFIILLLIPLVNILVFILLSIGCFIFLVSDNGLMSDQKKENCQLSNFDVLKIKRNLLLIPFLILPLYFFVIHPILQGTGSTMSDRMFTTYYYPDSIKYLEAITLFVVFLPGLIAFTSFQFMSMKNNQLRPYATNFFYTMLFNYMIVALLSVITIFIFSFS